MGTQILSGSHNFVDEIFDLKNSLGRHLLIALVGSWFIAGLAQVSISLPLNPVPITGQTFGVLLIGCLLGTRKAGLASLLYLFQGGLGLPFFAKGSAGVAVLVGPTGGYLIGMVLAAVVVGSLAELRLDQKFKSSIPLFLIGHVLIFTCGLLWLGQFVGYEKVVTLGLVPFLPGLVFKTLLAAFVCRLVRRI